MSLSLSSKFGADEETRMVVESGIWTRFSSLKNAFRLYTNVKKALFKSVHKRIPVLNQQL